MTPKQLISRHKSIFKIRGIEDKTGLGINALSHAINSENRPLQAYQEAKIKTLLKQLRNDLNKVRL